MAGKCYNGLKYEGVIGLKYGGEGLQRIEIWRIGIIPY